MFKIYFKKRKKTKKNRGNNNFIAGQINDEPLKLNPMTLNDFDILLSDQFWMALNWNAVNDLNHIQEYKKEESVSIIIWTDDLNHIHDLDRWALRHGCSKSRIQEGRKCFYYSLFKLYRRIAIYIKTCSTRKEKNDVERRVK